MADALVTLFILFVLGAVISAKQWPEWTRYVRSANWPTTSGTVESGEVSTFRGRSGRTFEASETATAKVSYSYHLGDTYFSGYHTRIFNNEQEAWSFVDELKGQRVEVRYNPKKPDVSVLRGP
jgi:hypothetical protein